MRTVYWASFPEDNFFISELKYYSPKNILKDLDNKKFFGGAGGVCPAILDDARNTFSIKAPIDFSITFDDDWTHANSKYEYNSNFIEKFIGNIDDKVIQLAAPTYLFFSEESLIMNQLPPYYEETEFTKNCIGLSASFNIAHWFRVVKPSFRMRKDCKTIDFNQGDSLTYIKFFTDDKINLVQFDASPFLTSTLMSGIMGYKQNRKFSLVPTRLQEGYEAFKRANYNKRILKIIKDNLL
tara:strand:- start:65 stop:781 length:717 start_codon:yes stop_codon:yes gene_type:complete